MFLKLIAVTALPRLTRGVLAVSNTHTHTHTPPRLRPGLNQINMAISTTPKLKQIKKITYKGYQARISREQDTDLLFVAWHTPQGCEVVNWDDTPEQKAILEELLNRANLWATDKLLKMWCY